MVDPAAKSKYSKIKNFSSGEKELLKIACSADDVGLSKTAATIRRAAAELDVLRREREWQPIDTAPKDGTVVDILLRYKHGKRFVVCAGHWAHGDGDGLMPAFGPGWFQWSGSCFTEVPNPTHWMTLPTVSITPPASGIEG